MNVESLLGLPSITSNAPVKFGDAQSSASSQAIGGVISGDFTVGGLSTKDIILYGGIALVAWLILK